MFENLLAAYNPETGDSARKQTGSYYTPRPIVDYMVEEALVATLTGIYDPEAVAYEYRTVMHDFLDMFVFALIIVPICILALLTGEN